MRIIQKKCKIVKEIISQRFTLADREKSSAGAQLFQAVCQPVRVSCWLFLCPDGLKLKKLNHKNLEGSPFR